MQNRIPLPDPKTDYFKDAFDYLETIKKRKAAQEEAAQELAEKKSEFGKTYGLDQQKLNDLNNYRQQLIANKSLPGTAGEVMGLEKIKGQYGENSPQYQLAKRAFESQVSAREGLAANRENPNKYASAQQKNLNAFESQLKKDNPNASDEQIRQMASNYLQGEEGKKEDTNLPSLSGEASAIRSSIFKTNSTAALQNQAANLNNTVDELNAIDISPLKNYTGAKGTLKFNMQKLNPNSRDKDWYDYDAFKNSTQIYAMDTLRKGFGTSVVPGYVYETLGKMANPVDPIWGDPKQLEARWNKTKELINKAAKNTTKQAQRGATVNLGSEGNNISAPSKKRLKYNSQIGDFEEVS